jgi:hypothetical protein
MLIVTNEMKSHYDDVIDRYRNTPLFLKSNERLSRTINCFVDSCLSVPVARCIICSKYCCYNHVHICLQTHPNEIEIINQIKHKC